MTIITIEELQANFDNYLERVEKGETLIIGSKNGNVVMIPFNENLKLSEIV